MQTQLTKAIKESQKYQETNKNLNEKINKFHSDLKLKFNLKGVQNDSIFSDLELFLNSPLLTISNREISNLKQASVE